VVDCWSTCGHLVIVLVGRAATDMKPDSLCEMDEYIIADRREPRGGEQYRHDLGNYMPGFVKMKAPTASPEGVVLLLK
jgi:hypothetical protein